jgi:hypothetical protein
VWSALDNSGTSSSSWPGRRPFFHRDKTLALGSLSGQFLGTAYRLGFLPHPPLGRFFVGTPALHFAEQALALQFLLQNAERLIDIVISDKYLQTVSLLGNEEYPAGKECGRL